jgi:hypoxanthine-guanine phosphoribosyltransferase
LRVLSINASVAFWRPGGTNRVPVFVIPVAQDSDCIIVQDIIDTGFTIVRAAEVLCLSSC